MEILFHSDQLNYRGTTNSIVDYATYNQEILGNESVLVYNRTIGDGIDVGSEQKVIDDLSKIFQVLSYENNQELNDIASKFDLCYSQRSGKLETTDKIVIDTSGGFSVVKENKEAIVTSTKFGVHAVFQWYFPHGDVHAYISEWLSQEIKRTYELSYQPLFVPYIVDLPEPTKSLRKELGIPKDALVIGRHGGYKTFDVEFVREAVKILAQVRKDIVFLFANTMPFYDHPNIIYMKPFFDQQTKSNFIHTCDAMLHARDLGESFGLSICEFLYQNKPVLSWEGGFDRNHVHMLKDYNLLYNKDNIYSKIMELPDLIKNQNYKQIVEPFTPKNVMKKFEEVFIQ